VAYLVKCPHCGRPKRIDVRDYNPSLKAYAYKFPDGAMYVGPGPTMYRCPDCNEQYAVGTQPIDPAERAPVPQTGVALASNMVFPWDEKSKIALT